MFNYNTLQLRNKVNTVNTVCYSILLYDNPKFPPNKNLAKTQRTPPPPKRVTYYLNGPLRQKHKHQKCWKLYILVFSYLITKFHTVFEKLFHFNFCLNLKMDLWKKWPSFWNLMTFGKLKLVFKSCVFYQRYDHLFTPVLHI